MIMKLSLVIALHVVFAAISFAAAPASAADLTLSDVNGAAFAAAAEDQSRAVIVKAQVLLDRAGFSSGVINGRMSENFANALRAFQRQGDIAETGDLDEATWTLIKTSEAPAMVEYTISKADVQGPFVPELPDSLDKMTTLTRLAYTGPRERLAERFHMDEGLLQDLNPDKAFDKPGTTIVVADVKRRLPISAVVKIEVDKQKHVIRAFEAGDKLVGVYPASIGSAEKPAPTGTLKITRIIHNPVYYYDPRFNFPGVEAKTRLKIAPGPNNPVGAVWMNLNARSYGIHGTAEPEEVGKVGSHGCVRLTNWDAWALATMVRRGTVVVFIE
jgi:lipoprotein-anchoring transpeptidase ErfK/SrfK